MIRKEVVQELVSAFGRKEASKILLAAKKQQKLENKWKNKLGELYDKVNAEVIRQLELGVKTADIEKIFDQFFTQHAIEITGDAMKQAQSMVEVKKKPRLALPKLPRSLKDLIQIWDKWRYGVIDKRQRKFGEQIKKAYLDKVKKVWHEKSDDFRNGGEDTRSQITKEIKEAADTTRARAETIVQTETTNYYNAVRENVYNQASDITHYLFIAIRDNRTTKWCADYKQGGRSGLVYKKGSDYLTRERPACHWNCRSEILPLSILNPAHRKFIEDKNRWRENNSPFPLPKGWRSS